MLYLASPYSHPDEQRRFRRFLAAREYVWQRMGQGELIFSPIVYAHQFDRDFQAPFDHTPWIPMNKWYIENCRFIEVLKLRDWEQSEGIKQEIALARSINKHVVYVAPLDHTKDW
jgi:hypothetical protein